MDLKHAIKDAVAKNLREFGYPDASAENVTSVRLFAMFARDQVQDFGRKHIANAEVQDAVAVVLAEIDATVEAG